MTTWPQIIEQAAQQFITIAKAHNQVVWAEESQFAIQALEKNPALAECTPKSFQNALINVASVGLTLNPVLGFAYLVPESEKMTINGKDVYLKTCNLRLSYRGLVKIATDSGSIMWAKAETVGENDVFEYNGPFTLPKHVCPNPFNRGKTVGVYCVAKTHQGDYLVDIMGADELTKIKSCAKTKSVWDKWPDEQAKKSIIKRARKQWPPTDRTDRLDTAIAIDNEIDGADFTESAPDPEPVAALPPPPGISDDGFMLALAKIASGELQAEQLKAKRTLTEDQLKKLQEATSDPV